MTQRDLMLSCQKDEKHLSGFQLRTYEGIHHYRNPMDVREPFHVTNREVFPRLAVLRFFSSHESHEWTRMANASVATTLAVGTCLRHVLPVDSYAQVGDLHAKAKHPEP